MPDSNLPFRPYLNPEMAQYENTSSLKDFSQTLSNPVFEEESAEIDRRILLPNDLAFFKNSPEGIQKSDLIEFSYKSRFYNLAQVERLEDDEFLRLFSEQEESIIRSIHINSDLSDIHPNEVDFVILDELKIQFGELELDIYSLIPQDYKIVLVDEGILDSSKVDLLDNYILLDKNISSLGGLLTLLHEVGHVVNQDEDYEKEELVTFKGATFTIDQPADYKRNIVTERDASLFALKTLWKELRKDPQRKKDSVNYLKIFFYSYCLNYLKESNASLGLSEPTDPNYVDFFEPLP